MAKGQLFVGTRPSLSEGANDETSCNIPRNQFPVLENVSIVFVEHPRDNISCT